MVLKLRVEREQEGEVVRERPEAVDEFRQEAHHHDPGVEAGAIHDVVELEIVHHQQVPRSQMDELVPHLHIHLAVQRAEQFQLLVPGDALGEPARPVAEQPHRQGKLAVERKLVEPGSVQLRADVMGLEAEPARQFQQFPLTNGWRRFHGG